MRDKLYYNTETIKLSDVMIILIKNFISLIQTRDYFRKLFI